MIAQDQIVGLTKQVFMLEYLLNGLFPCQSDVVRMIRAKKREWAFNDKFEYRMLLATTNTGGTLNSQVFHANAGLIRSGQLEYGTYRASFGSVSDGFDIDMLVNLETKDKRAAFESDYATRIHSLRMNVASLFKNFAIHGRFGVVHQLRDSIKKPTIDAKFNPQDNTGFTPVIGTPFTIKVPINVFQSNFKRGKYLIKTKEVNVGGPDDPADVSELYLVLDNQPGRLSLVAIGTTVSAWDNGQFIEVAQNREIVGGLSNRIFDNWTGGALTVPAGTVWAGQVLDQFNGTGSYTSGNDAVTGAMEGIADLFPWYTNPTTPENRLGLDRGFRDQKDRLMYSTEQAGGWIVQEQGEHIIDAIMRGAMLTKATVPYTDIGIWMNPVTRAQMGYEEGDNVKVIRDNMLAGPIIYQRGVKSTNYQIGSQVVNEVIEDLNMPTDVILIGPKDDLSYNCWDNSLAQIDDYVQETWSKSEPPKPENIVIPDEFITKLDLSNRITFGSPQLNDGALSSFTYGNGFRHPKNSLPIALHEMGALFTEHPFAYTVVKLREPIAELTTV